MSKFTGTKIGETHLETAILGGDTHFFVPVCLFHFVSGSFQAVYIKSMHFIPIVSSFFFLCELLLFA